MLDRFRNWLAPTSDEPEIAHRQYILNIVLLGLAGPGLIFGIVMTVLWILGYTPMAGAISGLGVQPFYLLSYWLGRRGRVTLAGYIPVTVVFIVMAASTAFVGIGHITTIGFAMVVSTAGVLIGLGAAVLFVVLSIAAYALAGMAQVAGFIPGALLPEAAVAADAIGMGLGLSVLVVLNWLSNREMAGALDRERQLASSLQQRSLELEEQVEERTQGLQRRAVQLQTTSDIAKLAAEFSDPRDLMAQVIDLIQNRFGFYHASIFIMDEFGAWAELAASTGEAGKRMLARRHRLAVGSASIVGWVTSNRLPRIAMDVESDPFHFKNPLLPDTRAEIAVPLLVGPRLLGVLDVQSSEPAAFTEADVRTLEAIAGELAIAIDSARIQEEMRQRLESIERTFRGRVRESWGRLMQSGVSTIIRLGSQGDLREADETGFSAFNRAAQEGTTIVLAENQEISVPVTVRGEVVATISAQKPASAERWTPDEIGLIEAVANQAALSLENARQRADEQRRLAELEVLNRVSQAVSQMLRLDTLYRVIHSQINQIFGDTDLSIALYNPQEETISFPFAVERGENYERQTVPYGEGLVSLVLRSRQPLLLVEDVERMAQVLGVQQKGQFAKSWLGVPMMVGDEAVGVISVQDLDEEQRFNDEDAALLTTIASQVAAAIQNTRLLDQVQRAARRERLTREITSKVRRSPDLRTILQTTAREIGHALQAGRATVRLGDQISEIPQHASVQAEEKSVKEDRAETRILDDPADLEGIANNLEDQPTETETVETEFTGEENGDQSPNSSIEESGV
jgi:GAF domain-containing protein